MKIAVFILVLAVIVSVTVSSPLLKEEVNNENKNVEKDAAIQEIAKNSQDNSKLGDDCYEADCNVSCWQQGHIGGRCVAVGRASVCECY
ncbi:uncharacterized protein isoform X2 [Leptinotarsa decemlineata]|uniref:uncharacterized protein isoform X2 n=1 Tax=Leptinotarsa decemlineata TaxID=7539 RepID=UPI003D30C3D5